jgi:hypothetical protein
MALDALNHRGNAIDGNRPLPLPEDIICDEKDPADVIQVGMGQENVIDLGLFLQGQRGSGPRIQEIPVFDQKAGQVKTQGLTPERA